MPPMLRSALARLPERREEQDRLAREEFEDKGFVGNLERLLLAFDDSINADLATRIAGWLAGPRELPTTVFRTDLQPPVSAEADVKDRTPHSDGREEVAARAAEAAPQGTLREAITEEARKGFDLLLIGVGPVQEADGGFSDPLQELAGGFEGPLAVAHTKAHRPDEPPDGRPRILVPVSGSGVSLRGAEIAVAIAQSRRARLHFIYVSTTRDQGVRPDAQDRASQVLKETTTIAERYELEVTTQVHADASPERAIIREIDAVRADLVVMGVDRLQGSVLDFGSVAAAVLAGSSAPVLLVSTEAGQAARSSTAKP
jgi:nucleotide-binding universal stress UspA family protein